MATSLADATAAPSTVTLNGKEYRISPLRDKDFGEFERWVQDRHIEVAKRNIGGLEAEDRQALLIHAYDQATKVTIQSSIAMRYMKTIEGGAKVTEIMLRREHPEVTYEQVLEWLTDPDNFNAVMGSVDSLNYTPEKNEPTAEPIVKAKERPAQ